MRRRVRAPAHLRAPGHDRVPGVGRAPDSPVRRSAAPGDRTPRLHLAWLVLPLLVLAACGGEDGAGADGFEDDAAVPPAARIDGDGLDTAAPGGAAPGTAPDRSAGDTVEPAPASEADTAGDWSVRPVRAPSDEGAPATLVAVRTARHPSYDRVVFEFAERIPGYTVGYVDGPPVQCGSGFEVDPGAPHALSIDLRPAVAHDDAGRPTIQDRDRAPGLPVLRTARLTCDFEAIVEWIVGTSRRVPTRVIELTAPPRLVVDLRQR